MSTNTQPVVVEALSETTFDEEVLGSPVPVVVDMWTPWCGPCKTLEPIIEDLARELDGTMRFRKVNADDHPALAARFDVMSFPTLLVFVDGKLVQRLIGARGRRHLLEELATFL